MRSFWSGFGMSSTSWAVVHPESSLAVCTMRMFQLASKKANCMRAHPRHADQLVVWSCLNLTKVLWGGVGSWCDCLHSPQKIIVLVFLTYYVCFEVCYGGEARLRQHSFPLDAHSSPPLPSQSFHGWDRYSRHEAHIVSSNQGGGRACLPSIVHFPNPACDLAAKKWTDLGRGRPDHIINFSRRLSSAFPRVW